MKVGDLVRDTQFKDMGIITEITETTYTGKLELIYHVLFTDGSKDELYDTYLEVISESR